MKTLEEEAKEYAKELVKARTIKDYEGGWMESVYMYVVQNSKWVQAEKIKAQIDAFEDANCVWECPQFIDKIAELKQQLKKLEE